MYYVFHTIYSAFSNCGFLSIDISPCAVKRVHYFSRFDELGGVKVLVLLLKQESEAVRIFAIKTLGEVQVVNNKVLFLKSLYRLGVFVALLECPF